MSTVAPERSRTSVFRFRLVAAVAVLMALALVQDPGLVVADTKFDLVASPVDWLARSLHLWDAEGGFGQVQNQAYGYLWPMGPFFVLGHLLDLPGWVVQRLWQGLVTSVALVGTAKVARALGVRSDLACLVAGFAFALSPRLLTSLGPISIEVWPSALAPWVLLPLVRGALSGSPRRAAALSALAVAMVGGVNAAATVAVLPLGAIWLLTRTPGPRRRSLMLWWPVFTALGTLWWLVPLFVMGAYSPPFLDYTETAAVTTFPTTLFDALRGTSHWVPYGDLGWRAGNDLLRTSWVALNSGVLLLLGLAGLIDRRTPHRTFLTLSLLAGVLLVTFGHQGAVQGWFAESLADQLDGGLAPLRNLHKFDPVLRLPLVLGLGLVVDRALQARTERPAAPRAERVNRLVLVAAAVVALAGTSTPALGGRVEQAGATLGVPDYWVQAADYVDDTSEGGGALLLPASGFADYVWGDTRDEPMQWLAGSRWAVRNVAGQLEPGTIRALDGIEQRFTEGRGSSGLTAYLRRAGIEQLVVRNDLRRLDDVPDPTLVHQAIAQSPGIVRAATFGPEVGGDAHLGAGADRVVVNDGRQARYPAVEIFDVTAPSAPTVSAGVPSMVVAGPEDLPDLLDLDVLGTAPVELPADGADEESPRPRRVVLTDGLRQRERSFGRIHDGSSAVLTPGDVRRTASRVRDYEIPELDRWSTTARLDGADAVSASSSLSDADALGGSRRGALPFAALDGAADTAWESAFAPDERAWWRVDLAAPQDVEAITLTASTDRASQTLRVVTAHGESSPVRLSAGGTRRVVLPTGGDGSSAVSWLRVEDASDSGGRQLGLAEVTIPGVQVQRVLDLPALPDSWGAPDVVVLEADRDARTGCVVVGADTRCAKDRDRTAEDGPDLRRSFDLADSASYAVSVRVRPRAGQALDALALDGQPVSAQASSSAVPDPRAGAVAAVDGDTSTAWIAGADDDRPDLRLGWIGQRSISSLDLALAPDTAARLPERVRLRFFRDGQRAERVDVTLDGGRATFAPVRADGVRLRVLSAPPISSVGFDGIADEVPVGVGEVSLGGLPYLPLGLSADPVAMPCGSGPAVRVGERLLLTRVVAAPRDLLSEQDLPAEVCGGRDVVDLAAGAVDVSAPRNDAFDAASVVLTSTDDPLPGSSPVPAGGDLSGPVERTLRPVEGAAVVALRENANAGWVATQGGTRLAPVTLDGWQQGFVLKGDGDVTVRFAPDRDYRVGLLVGWLALVALLVMLWLTGSRWAGSHPAALAERRPTRPLAVVVALLAAGLVAGTGGLALGVGVVVLAEVLERRLPEVVPWLLAGPVLVAAFVYALSPWGSSSGWAGSTAWVGYLAVVPLVAVVLAGSRSTSLFKRMPGTSTKR